MYISDVLHVKGPEVFTIGEDKTIANATDVLISNHIGSLLVLNKEGKIVGIFSERDALRSCHDNEGNCDEIKVKDVMTKNIIFAESKDDVDYVLGIITKNRIRHVPVMKDKRLVGIVSIGDLVKHLLKEQQFENKYLIDYIQGNTPKG
jgi:CBS domain-containing protein